MSKPQLYGSVALLLILSGVSSIGASTRAAIAATAATSGEAMPVGDLPGWKQVFADDFATAVPPGSFPSAVAGRWGAYPYPAKDTSRNGTYWPEKVISQQGGVMDLYLHTEGGTHMVASPQPRLFPGVSAGRGQLYGRYAIRFRSDPVPGYKIAWMLWPDSGVWPRDGEIDFPEANLNSTICAYMHRLGGGSGSDQDAYCTSSAYSPWHTAVIEWTPTYLSFILDGAVIGRSTNRIPNTPMHWVLQTETSLTAMPTDAAAGHVQIDWVAIYRLDPSAGPSAAVPVRRGPPGPAAGNSLVPQSSSARDLPGGTAISSDRVPPHERDAAQTPHPSSPRGSSARPGRRIEPATASDHWPASPRLLAEAVQASVRGLKAFGAVAGQGLQALRQGVERLGDLWHRATLLMT